MARRGAVFPYRNAWVNMQITDTFIQCSYHRVKFSHGSHYTINAISKRIISNLIAAEYHRLSKKGN